MVSTVKFGKSLTALAVACAAQSALAADSWFDSASLEVGGGEHVQMVRGALQSDWNKNWLAMNGRHLSGYWDFNLAQWRATAHRGVSGDRQNITVIGVTPVFRYERDDKFGWYAEAGIGASLFSELYNNSGNRLSTAYEFADHVGAGYVLSNNWDVSARIQHYSNGGIKHPNTGVNWFVLKAAYRF
jgi:hypothetical protein